MKVKPFQNWQVGLEIGEQTAANQICMPKIDAERSHE